MKALRDLESFATTVNDLDDRLPKGRSRCFDVGQWGGWGVNCPVFLDGECGEPQEISKQDVIDEHGDDAEQVLKLYPCFSSPDL